MLGPLTKDPDGSEIYGLDWSDFLGADTIASSDWTVPTGLTENAATNDTTSTQIRVSGGTVGTQYQLVNRITTDAGATYDRTVLLICMNR